MILAEVDIVQAILIFVAITLVAHLLLTFLTISRFIKNKFQEAPTLIQRILLVMLGGLAAFMWLSQKDKFELKSRALKDAKKADLED